LTTEGGWRGREAPQRNESESKAKRNKVDRRTNRKKKKEKLKTKRTTENNQRLEQPNVGTTFARGPLNEKFINLNH